MCSSARRVSDTSPSASAFMIAMRPRGASVSWPRTRNVGQTGTHSPQWTQTRASKRKLGGSASGG
jgi:hypothetical protein